MKRFPYLMLALLLVTAGANAIVIRGHVPDSKYLVPESAFPALVDLPGEGQGTLIAPRWVVTAGHATQGYMLMEVRIDGKWRRVEHVFLYPGFKNEYDKVKQAAHHPSVKNWPEIESAFKSMHDIALIELEQPVRDVAPVPLYTKSDELGKVVEIFGKGATGNGRVGQYPIRHITASCEGHTTASLAHKGSGWITTSIAAPMRCLLQAFSVTATAAGQSSSSPKDSGGSPGCQIGNTGRKGIPSLRKAFAGKSSPIHASRIT